VLEFALLPFFSIETGLHVVSSDATILVMPIMAKLGGRVGIMELSFDIGFTIGGGFSIGGTLGVRAGEGILFAKFIGIPNTSVPEGIQVNSAGLGLIGYKIGVGRNRR
jgi:hypothetical protein